MRRASCLLCLNYLQIELRKEVGTRSVLGLCFRGAKTNTVLHSQAPAVHPFARVQAPWTNRGQGADIIFKLVRARFVAGGRPWALNGRVMNTLSKVLAVFCLLLSAVAYGFYSHASSNTVSRYDGETPVSVATSADGKTVYVGKQGQVFKSINGGVDWEVVK